MKVEVLTFGPLLHALFGLGLSYGLMSDKTVQDLLNDESLYLRLVELSKKLAHKQGGHNKFLESYNMTLDIKAPRYWWQEFDTYRVGVTKQSESTMHTIMSRELEQDDFEGGTYYEILDKLHEIHREYLQAKAEGDAEWENKCFMGMKNALPESFLQRRLVVTNFKVLQDMYYQRKNHKLPEWKIFFDAIKAKFHDFCLCRLEHYYIFGDDA